MARVALTSQDMMGATQEWRESSAELGALEWIPTDHLPDEPQLAPTDVGPEDIAFLQYTSGSTAQPTGLRVSHGSFVQDMERMPAAWAMGSDSHMHRRTTAFPDLGLLSMEKRPFG